MTAEAAPKVNLRGLIVFIIFNPYEYDREAATSFGGECGEEGKITG
jgi:hypothetical protein